VVAGDYVGSHQDRALFGGNWYGLRDHSADASSHIREGSMETD